MKAIKSIKHLNKTNVWKAMTGMKTLNVSKKEKHVESHECHGHRNTDESVEGSEGHGNLDILINTKAPQVAKAMKTRNVIKHLGDNMVTYTKQHITILFSHKCQCNCNDVSQYQ